MMVIDASVLLDAMASPATAEADIKTLEAAEALYAPHVIDLEVINGLRKMLLSQRIDMEQADSALSILQSLPITRVDITMITNDIWTLRDNFTSYDAAYVALARKLEVPLMTRDARLASHAKRHVKIV
jgi:predicted nucleic acid-binding protein